MSETYQGSAVEAEDGPQALDESAFERLSNAQVTALYLQARNAFRKLIGRAERISRGSGGILSEGNRMFWGSVLFTRISVTAKSLNKLLPDPKPRQHWDFSAAASLARNLVEACLVYHWLCGEEIADEVRAGRFILLYLHDYGSRRRLFPEQFTDPDPVYEDLVAQFDANSYLATFSGSQRKVALRGERTPFVQDDVLIEMGVDASWFRGMYRFFSQHTHTGPIAFYRMVDQDRGTGVETRQEKKYMLLAIGYAAEFLHRATEEHLTIFPDADIRAPHLTPQQITRNVEEAQGRRRRR
jgi:hypothetical protein